MDTLIPFHAASIHIVPIDGQLAILVDPIEILANPDAPSMVAEVIRGLGAGRGEEVLIYGGCIQDVLEHAVVPAGEMFAFHLPKSRKLVAV